MLSKRQKIKRADFPKGVRGHAYYMPNSSLTIFPSESTENTYAFVISAKSVKKATDRNRLRRRGYNIIKDLAPYKRHSTRAVFNLKKGAQKLSYADFEDEIKDLLARAKFI